MRPWMEMMQSKERMKAWKEKKHLKESLGMIIQY